MTWILLLVIFYIFNGFNDLYNSKYYSLEYLKKYVKLRYFFHASNPDEIKCVMINQIALCLNYFYVLRILIYSMKIIIFRAGVAYQGYFTLNEV